jgi:uncharacterized protein (DUF58 family)
MSIFHNRIIINGLKFYVCVLLIIVAILSGPATAVAAILVLFVFVFLQLWPGNVVLGLIGSYFVFFAVAILIMPVSNFMISNLLALPVLFLVTNGLMNSAGFLPLRKSRNSRNFTQTGIILTFIAMVNLIVALFLGSAALILAGSVAVIYIGVLSCVSFSLLSAKSVVVEKIQERIIAGTTAGLQVNLRPKTAIIGVLSLDSPYDWLKIHSPVLPSNRDPMILRLSLTPLLAGPSEASVNVLAVDCWGLTQVQFQINPVQLHVIPRARHAAWLARRYLEATKPGGLPMISNVGAVRPQFGFRRGIEYYASQLYQPGDELRNIDWKHSAKYNKMITKEFVEFHGQAAVMLINLTVSDAEEADKLAQKIIITALSLANEQIPAVIAAYDRSGVKLVTPSLRPPQLVVMALEITKEITMFANPGKYLYRADLGRLRADIDRLASVEGDSSKTLAQLLSVEYAAILRNVASNPATLAINESMWHAHQQPTFVTVSMLNHDVDAIEANRFFLTKRGYAFVAV